MTTIALLGAGGKMGYRLAMNLKGTEYDVLHVEVSEEGRQRLKDEVNVSCVEQKEAIPKADAVILAVPDRLIGKILSTFIDDLKPGSAVIMLDAAAPHGGNIPMRDDLTYFVTHPCHPPIFNDETSPEARQDYFGGIAAKQHIICGMHQGPDEHFKMCEDIGRTIYKPVMNSHRCSIEQMVILEPGLSESVGATFAMALAEAVDETVRRGVPRDAAEDFILGHLTILLAVAFQKLPGARLSDGCMLAIDEAKPLIFQNGWVENIFNQKTIDAAVASICE